MSRRPRLKTEPSLNNPENSREKAISSLFTHPLFLYLRSSSVRMKIKPREIYWGNRDGSVPASSSGTSFFRMAGRGERETRVACDEPQGTMGRVQTTGEARLARCLFPAFLCAHIFIERVTSGYEAGLVPSSFILRFPFVLVLRVRPCVQ